MTGNSSTGARTALRTVGVVLVVLGLAVQAGAAQLPVAQGATEVGETGDGATAVDVETTWADPINESSVVAAGNVTALADNASATVWLEYRANGSASWQSTARQTVESVGSFREVVTGLTSGASYEYRARAEAGNDTVSGSVGTFEVPDNPPTVETEPAETVKESGAALTGSVQWLGNAESAEVRFAYRPVGADEFQRTPARTVTSDGSVEWFVETLEPNTTYEYRVEATASDGDAATGSLVEFTTDEPFAVRTDEVTPVNATAVTVDATVENFGDAPSADGFVQYREAGADTWRTAVQTGASSAGAFGGNVTGLDPGTDYQFRAYGLASDGDSDYGAVANVTTGDGPDSAPAAAPTGATGVTEDSARLTATVTDLGGADSAEVSFVLRRDGAEQGETVAASNVSAPGDVAATVDGLAADASYEYRAVVEASDGDAVETDAAAFATDTEFAVRTESASTVNGTAVTVTGAVADLGGADAATLVFEYRANGTTEWTRAGTSKLDAAGSDAVTVTGLEPGAEYEVRVTGAAVDNDRDTGESLPVATDADPAPAVTTTGATDVSEHSARLTATVTDLGGADSADVTFEWRRAGTEQWGPVGTRTVTGPADLNATFRDFQANSTYEFRAVVTASDGDTATGGVRTLTTDAEFSVVTDSVVAVNDTAVSVNGRVVDLGGADAATATVEYRAVGASEWSTAAPTKRSTAGDVDATVTGLDPGTEYEVRVTATASDGDSDAGRVLSARTDAPLAVSTTGAVEVNGSAATLTGNLTAIGGADDASVAFEYRAGGDDDWQTVSAGNVSSPGEFRRTVTGLDAGATYEFRAVATASDGDDAAGETRTLTTEASESAPAIDSFDVWEFWSPNPHLAFMAVWDVSDDDGDLDEVTVEVVDGDGAVVDSATTDAAGDEHGGANYFRLKHVDGEEFTVRLVVTDESGETTTDTRTVSD